VTKATDQFVSLVIQQQLVLDLQSKFA
jgi:hypothetical protein